jgi:hypothetical protein
MRSSFVVTGSLLACLVGGVVVAQDKPADTMEIFREKARADKKLVVASVLELTESEAKVFWPVYNAYQSDMVAHYDRLIKLIGTYAKAYSAMTDETATKLVTEYLALERNHAALSWRRRCRSSTAASTRPWPSCIRARPAPDL